MIAAPAVVPVATQPGTAEAANAPGEFQKAQDGAKLRAVKQIGRGGGFAGPLSRLSHAVGDGIAV